MITGVCCALLRSAQPSEAKEEGAWDPIRSLTHGYERVYHYGKFPQRYITTFLHLSSFCFSPRPDTSVSDRAISAINSVHHQDSCEILIQHNAINGQTKMPIRVYIKRIKQFWHFILIKDMPDCKEDGINPGLLTGTFYMRFTGTYRGVNFFCSTHATARVSIVSRLACAGP